VAWGWKLVSILEGHRAQLTACACSGAADGGGLRVGWGTTATLTDVAITGNQADGGGISNRGTLNLTRALVAGNRAVASTGGGVFSQGTAILTNVTVHGNSTGAELASGIHHTGFAGGMLLKNVAIA
jgi:hypothetical protein